MRIGRLVFLGDGFRTHSMLKQGKPHEPAERLAKLLRPIFQSMGFDMVTAARFRSGPLADVYERMFGLPESAFTWAYRSQVLTARLRYFYDIVISNADLVVGFEMPESAYAFCTEQGIPVIDTGFHFARFGPDYLLKARSNDARITGLLRKIRGEVAVADVISKQVNDLDLDRYFRESDQISVFVMQTRFDKSKFDGTGFVDDVALVEDLDEAFDFYKPHPHEPRPELEYVLHRRGARPFPTQYATYPFILDHGRRTSLTSVSSGLIAEADIVGVRDARYLVGFPWRIEGYEKYTSDGWTLSDAFVPVDKRFFDKKFWEVLCGIRNIDPDQITPPNLSVRDYWNVKWS